MSDDVGSVPAPRQWVLRVQGGVVLDTPLTPGPRSRPWLGVLWRDHRQPSGWARHVLAPGPHGRGWAAAHAVTRSDGHRRVLSALTPGDVVEFGADATRARRFRRPAVEVVRWHGVVLATDPERVVVLGPFGDPGAAWELAQRYLHAWRDDRLVDLPQLPEEPALDAAPALDADRQLPASAEPTPPTPISGSTRVDDPAHGTLVVDAAAFAAAMAHTPAELAELLGAAAPQVGLRGDEPHTTLAALAARHTPARLQPDADVGALGRAATYAAGAQWTVARDDPGGDTRSIRPPRQWSPDGFGWGHDGDTARELAYALLADATGSPDVARVLADRYTAEVVAHLPATWRLAVDDVAGWADAALTTPTTTAAAASVAGRPLPGFEAGL